MNFHIFTSSFLLITKSTQTFVLHTVYSQYDAYYIGAMGNRTVSWQKNTS